MKLSDFSSWLWILALGCVFLEEDSGNCWSDSPLKRDRPSNVSDNIVAELKKTLI